MTQKSARAGLATHELKPKRNPTLRLCTKQPNGAPGSANLGVRCHDRWQHSFARPKCVVVDFYDTGEIVVLVEDHAGKTHIWEAEERAPCSATVWIPLTLRTPPPEGVRFWVKLDNGCEHYATRLGNEIHVGVPDSFRPNAVQWRPEDESPNAPAHRPAREEIEM